MNWHFIKIKKSQGRHTDVYVDFERELSSLPGWTSLVAKGKYFQRFTNTILIKKFRKNRRPLPALSFSPSRNLFAILSGTQYAKLLPYFLNKHARKAIYMFDPWPPLNELNKNAFQSIGIQLVFFPAKQAVDYFNQQKMANFKAIWIPEGITSSNYSFVPLKEKNIDLLQYGRQWNWLHEELLKSEIEKKFNYQYDNNGASGKLQFATRQEFTHTLAKSKIAVCVPRNLTHPELVQDLSTLTTRYFECMSSKCLIWGTAPAELIELFGYNPVIEIDRSRPFEQLQSLLSNYEEHLPLIEKNYQQVLQKHQWKDRAKQIAGQLEIEFNEK